MGKPLSGWVAGGIAAPSPPFLFQAPSQLSPKRASTPTLLHEARRLAATRDWGPLGRRGNEAHKAVACSRQWSIAGQDVRDNYAEDRKVEHTS